MTKEETTDRHLKNRKALLAAVAGEVFGPGSRFADGDCLLVEGTPYDPDKEIVFDDWKTYGEVRPTVKDTGEEVLKEERPTSHFGLGILFPKLGDEFIAEEEEQLASEEAGIGVGEGKLDAEEELALTEHEKAEKKREKIAERRSSNRSRAAFGGSADDEESDPATEVADLRLSNLRKQRSIGVSFVADTSRDGKLAVRITGGRYKRFTSVSVKDSRKQIVWWARRAVNQVILIPLAKIAAAVGSMDPIPVDVPVEKGLPPLRIQLEVFVRDRDRIPGDEAPPSARLLTISLVNRTECHDRGLTDEHCLFQTRFEVKADRGTLLPYPREELVNKSAEQESLDLLYRSEQTFATGHGCAGAWEADEGEGFANSVLAEPLPSCETPSITPDLEYKAGGVEKVKKVSIRLSLLANDKKVDEALAQLRLLVDLYEKWIEERRTEVEKLGERHKTTAERHLGECRTALARMRRGIEILESDPDSDASLAFRMTNEAMLLQALASQAPTRLVHRDNQAQRDVFEPAFAAPDPDSQEGQDRAWRPFQIAFLLMNISALSDPSDPGREIVDLIWFPTGGGKTEAYLACAAFSMFMRRLRNPQDLGTHVIMRYTLRLLTAQQFQRASSLICAMDHMRGRNESRLGKDPFTIGIWVGGDTTPNNRKAAVKAHAKAKRNGEEDYKMILLKCPWCGAVMGPQRKGGQDSGYEIRGAFKKGEDVELRCSDRSCDFGKGLPVEVIDENIYENPPTYVIATVDKFASLAWRPECRSLFGINDEGQRDKSPPGLIIQDELHLITGPLGSMVGLYETLIDELSTDRRSDDRPVKPKLIAATATTRASDRQIRDLYARDMTSIFPPPGLDAADSFFAKYARGEDGVRLPGRLYVGLLPLNYSSTLTASVRLFSATLAAANGFKTEPERDPWWTLLVFYNSLRELGGALTLFGADIPERLKNVQRRWYPNLKRRYVREVLELTGRLMNSEVPRALEALGRKYKDKPARGQFPVDACLASNIIEVGVDVDRLGVMAVSGQPKTTAQYIQATGRVGRKLPGLILMNYGPGKARDRSHYEQFQAYHSRLYAQVEPASVTPFTIPVLERALHAVMVAWVRQSLPKDDIVHPWPFSATILEEAATKSHELLKKRVKALVEEEKDQERVLQDLKHCFDERFKEWGSFHPEKWHEYFPTKDSGDQPLIRPYGSPCPPTWVNRTWETPNSLRGVDAECSPHIPAPEID